MADAVEGGVEIVDGREAQEAFAELAALEDFSLQSSISRGAGEDEALADGDFAAGFDEGAPEIFVSGFGTGSVRRTSMRPVGCCGCRGRGCGLRSEKPDLGNPAVVVGRSTRRLRWIRESKRCAKAGGNDAAVVEDEKIARPQQRREPGKFASRRAPVTRSTTSMRLRPRSAGGSCAISSSGRSKSKSADTQPAHLRGLLEVVDGLKAGALEGGVELLRASARILRWQDRPARGSIAPNSRKCG